MSGLQMRLPLAGHARVSHREGPRATKDRSFPADATNFEE